MKLLIPILFALSLVFLGGCAEECNENDAYSLDVDYSDPLYKGWHCRPRYEPATYPSYNPSDFTVPPLKLPTLEEMESKEESPKEEEELIPPTKKSASLFMD